MSPLSAESGTESPPAVSHSARLLRDGARAPQLPVLLPVLRTDPATTNAAPASEGTSGWCNRTACLLANSTRVRRIFFKIIINILLQDLRNLKEAQTSDSQAEVGHKVICDQGR